jgi:hypothetical protein
MTDQPQPTSTLDDYITSVADAARDGSLKGDDWTIKSAMTFVVSKSDISLKDFFARVNSEKLEGTGLIYRLDETREYCLTRTRLGCTYDGTINLFQGSDYALADFLNYEIKSE